MVLYQLLNWITIDARSPATFGYRIVVDDRGCDALDIYFNLASHRFAYAAHDLIESFKNLFPDIQIKCADRPSEFRFLRNDIECCT